MVIGPPSFICFSKVGIALPELPKTLPNELTYNNNYLNLN